MDKLQLHYTGFILSLEEKKKKVFVLPEKSQVLSGERI